MRETLSACSGQNAPVKASLPGPALGCPRPQAARRPWHPHTHRPAAGPVLPSRASAGFILTNKILSNTPGAQTEVSKSRLKIQVFRGSGGTALSMALPLSPQGQGTSPVWLRQTSSSKASTLVNLCWSEPMKGWLHGGPSADWEGPDGLWPWQCLLGSKPCVVGIPEEVWQGWWQWVMGLARGYRSLSPGTWESVLPSSSLQQ